MVSEADLTVIFILVAQIFYGNLLKSQYLLNALNALIPISLLVLSEHFKCNKFVYNKHRLAYFKLSTSCKSGAL